ncbi:putative Dehydrogenase/reductase SDR family member 11 [Hypsibius exemplaris]|uniref:Dehydrogenase/reductase SDR family member 11 n=1 Tax=Hypsibius exemplaris TaxID=2072580 RepID=A0A1W0WC15_HYPEX|nr:putative Dehydrogenase/reductase SDR family member 11 [Hypsibius exemplaris]
MILQDKIVLVTGAASGIGAAISSELARLGCVVIGADRNDTLVSRYDKVMEEEAGLKDVGSFHGIPCDLVEEASVAELFAQIEKSFGRLDVSICNAGSYKFASILTGTTSNWVDMLQLNVLATAMCLRDSVRLMTVSPAQSGHIIVMGSALGCKVSQPECLHFYSATKFAVRALAEGVREELVTAKHDIRVTHLAPGLVRTESSRQLVSAVAFTPLEVADIVAAVVFALQAPSHVNVSEIHIVSA